MAINRFKYFFCNFKMRIHFVSLKTRYQMAKNTMKYISKNSFNMSLLKVSLNKV